MIRNDAHDAAFFVLTLEKAVFLPANARMWRFAN